MVDARLKTIETYLREGADLRLRSLQLEDVILKAADVISQRFKSGGKLLLFGNGGSAADAQHIAAEFVGRFRSERTPLPALALSVNSSAVTAISNDYSFEDVFARQVRALARPGDVALGISTSGRSPNVLKGLEAAHEMGAMTIGLCGNGGDMARCCTIVLAVPATTTSLLQEVHIAIGHLLALLVEEDYIGR